MLFGAQVNLQCNVCSGDNMESKKLSKAFFKAEGSAAFVHKSEFSIRVLEACDNLQSNHTISCNFLPIKSTLRFSKKHIHGILAPFLVVPVQIYVRIVWFMFLGKKKNLKSKNFLDDNVKYL